LLDPHRLGLLFPRAPGLRAFPGRPEEESLFGMADVGDRDLDGAFNDGLEVRASRALRSAGRSLTRATMVVVVVLVMV